VNPQKNELLTLSSKHVEKAANLFTKAFFTYPLFKYIVQNPSKRPIIYPEIFRLMIKYTLKNGEAYATSEKMEGIALWLPHDKADISTFNALTNGALFLIIKAGFKITYRTISTSNFSSKIHHRIADFPHLYLFLIAVDPIKRGKGFASKLIKPMLEKAERKKLPVYLETHVKDIIPIYEHFGFNIQSHEMIPESNVDLWSMLKE
jgi:GNAT superfamily N-acetyltransferase